MVERDEPPSNVVELAAAELRKRRERNGAAPRNDNAAEPDAKWLEHVDAPGDGDEVSKVQETPRDPPKPLPPPPWLERISECNASWFTVAPPHRRWLLTDSRTRKGVLPQGKVGMLIGEGGVSKTMALVDLMIAVATGGAWLGTYDVAEGGRVLALLGEEDLEEVQRRSYYVARATGSPIPKPGSIVALPLAGIPCSLIEMDERGNPVDTVFLEWLRSYVSEHGPFALTVLDPLSRFAGCDVEGDNGAATRFVQALESIATGCSTTVLVAHHTSKIARLLGGAMTSSAARGATAIVDGMRWCAAMAVERVDAEGVGLDDLKETARFSVTKSNYSAKGESFLLRRDDDNGGALLPLDDVEKQAVASAKRSGSPSAQKKKERDEERKLRAAAVDAALLSIIGEQSGIKARELRAAVAARLGGCSHAVLDEALARCSAAIRRVPGIYPSVGFYLVEAETGSGGEDECVQSANSET